MGFSVADVLLDDIALLLADRKKKGSRRHMRSLKTAKEVFARVGNGPSLSDYQCRYDRMECVAKYSSW